MKYYIVQRKYLLCLLTLILIVSLSGCNNTVSKQSYKAEQANKSFTITLTDDLGRKVNFKAEPNRIVSLAPSNTEILFYLGLGNKVVGDTTYCDYPEAAKHCAKVGGFADPSLEKIVALKPDLVLATEMDQQLLKGLEDAGLKVLVLNANTIEETFHDIQLVGKAGGADDKAVTMTRGLKKRVNDIEGKIAKVPQDQRPTVYYEMWNEPLMSIGKNSLIGQMIKLAGGINITDDCKEQYPQISEEVIIERNPQVMINSYGHDNKVITPQEIGRRKGWQNLSFVKNHRIYTIDSDLLTLPGPRIVDGLEQMAEVLHPELLK